MAFYHILLGHLFGDFVLQTNRIAVNKPLYRRWGMIHALIVTLCMLVFAVPFGLKTSLLVLVAGFLHLFIDKIKAVLSNKYKLPELPAFIVDQVLHISIIAIASWFASGSPSYPAFNKHQIVFLLVLVFVTFFAAILNQYILSIFFPRKGNVLFQKGEKLSGIAIRFISTLSIYLSFKYSFLFLFFLPAVPAILLLQLQFYNKLPVNSKELVFKLIIDEFISAVGAGILLIF